MSKLKEKEANETIKRGPGRPKKTQLSIDNNERPKKEDFVAETKKRPGRPKKNQTTAEMNERPKKEDLVAETKKKTGRAKKNQNTTEMNERPKKAAVASEAKRKPGRPKKAENINSANERPKKENFEAKKKAGRPKRAQTDTQKSNMEVELAKALTFKNKNNKSISDEIFAYIGPVSLNEASKIINKLLTSDKQKINLLLSNNIDIE